MGHAKIGITLDRYGHLMPASEAASLLDSYLDGERPEYDGTASISGAERIVWAALPGAALFMSVEYLTGEPTGEQLPNGN